MKETHLYFSCLSRHSTVVLRVIFITSILISVFCAKGQNLPERDIVTGNVKDMGRNPLSGVSIKIKGKNTGTNTDEQGKFRLVAEANDTLIVSSVGFITQELAVNGRSGWNIVLLDDAQGLNEVVVVGYGTQKKAEVIGSVSQLSARDINERSVPQLRQALTGQLAGVTVIQRSGQPGAPGGSIQIRGVGSFGAGTAPLILVDGIAVSSMDEIDPNDVENISILKDASSASIYGSRAANGVILITTKFAKEEKVVLSYNGYLGLQVPTSVPEFVDSWEYAALRNEATGGGTGGYTDEEIRKFRDGSDPDHYPNINYVQNIFKDYATQTAHNFTIANKNKNSSYLLSSGYLFQNGIIGKNEYNRYNLRLNLNTDLAHNLKLSTRLSAIQLSDKQPNSPATITGAGMGMLGIIGYSVRFPSIYPDKLTNGDYGTGIVGTGTPVSFIESDSFYKNKSTDLNGNAILEWQLLNDLKISLVGGYVQRTNRNDVFYASQRLNPNVFLGPSKLNVNNDLDTYKTLQQLIEYNKIFSKQSVNVLVGHSYEAFYYENSSASRQDFPGNDIVVIDAGAAEGQLAGGTANESALESYFGRLKYSYDNKYLAEGSFRYDGSSRFPAANRYAFFPSAAIGWRVSEEPFLKNKISFLNDLKLKGSYGILGNQNIGNYPYQELFKTNFNYGFGNAISTGVANTTLVDPNIRWESTRTFDIGADARLFNGKVSLEAIYYNRYTYDILVSPNASVSNVLGFGVGDVNSGSLENKGWEFTANYRANIGRFTGFLSANFSIVNNTVLDLGVANVTQPNGLVGNGSNRFIGFPIGLYYGYLTDGLYVDDSDVDNYNQRSNQVALNPAPQPGDVKYKDISGPDGVPDGKVDATYDRTVLGSTIPKYTYGLNFGGTYKGFSISALIQAVSGVQGRLIDHAGYAFFTTDGNVQRWQMEERWTKENPNPNAAYPRLELVPNAGTPNTALSDYWVLNASYIKLRNVKLAYSLPSSIARSLGLNKLSLNAAAENVLTLSHYRAGWDPEINADRQNFYPIMANFTFGITAGF